MLTVPVPQSKSAEQGWECWEGQLQTHGWDKLIRTEPPSWDSKGELGWAQLPRVPSRSDNQLWLDRTL